MALYGNTTQLPKRNITYAVKVNGIIVGTAAPDTNGVLKTNITLQAGSTTVEITQDRTHIAPITTGSKTYQIYPNPASTDFFISDVSSKAEKTVQLTVFSTNGIKIASTIATTNRWCHIELPAGSYTISIDDGISHETRQLIIAR